MGAITKIFKKKAPAAPVGPDPNDPIVQQRQAEASKAGARDEVNKLFGYRNPIAYQTRQKMFGDVTGAARDLNMKYLTEDRDKAAEQVKIAMWRQGLAGGSTDVDKNAEVNRAFQEGVVDIGNRTDEMNRSLMGADEQARLQLLEQISNGMDQGTAVEQGRARLNAGLDNAIAQSRGRFIGDLFSNISGGLGNIAYQQGQGQVPGGYQTPPFNPIARPRNRSVRF